MRPSLGASRIRLLTSFAWAQSLWTDGEGLLMFEARITATAKAFPLVTVCMYDERTPFGSSHLHNALRTHAVIARGNVVRVNPSALVCGLWRRLHPAVPGVARRKPTASLSTLARRRSRDLPLTPHLAGHPVGRYSCTVIVCPEHR